MRTHLLPVSLSLLALGCAKTEPIPGAVSNVEPTSTTASTFELRLEGAPAFLTRADLASCTNPDEGPTAGALLRCKLTDAGSAKLAETTRNNLGKVFEFVIDGKVRMRPRFEAAITGGVLTIWLGDDTAAASEARRLANTLAR